ncbi:MAG: formate dehydrogenase subunit delta [Geminicoccaceae bacterium]
MNTHTLVQMANQIARAFAAKAEPEAVAATVDHILQFWDPRMRHGIETLPDAAAAGLSPVARAAVLRLAEREPVH